MSNVASATQSQNLASTILQQLLSGSNAQATSGLPPSVLEDILQSSTSSQSGSQVQLPAAITQALGGLLTGGSSSSVQSDLKTLQSYFQQNPDTLASLVASLQSAGGTYSSNGTTSGSQAPAAVTQALDGLLSGSDGSNAQSDLATVQGYFTQNPASLANLLTSFQGTSSASSEASSILSALTSNSAQDPLLAAIGGSSDSSSTFSLLG